MNASATLRPGDAPDGRRRDPRAAADAIHSGQLAPGSPVPAERVLCQEFGVARTSVREAIQARIAGYLERRGNRSVVAERLPAMQLHRRRSQGARAPAVRGAPGHRAGDRRAGRAPGDRRASAPRSPSSPRGPPRDARRVPRDRPRSSTPRSPRACGNPLLNEVHAKALAALFGSGEFASLLYAEVNRAEVDEIIDSRRPRPTGRSPTPSSRATAARRSPRWSPTSTTSSAAWWSDCCEHDDLRTWPISTATSSTTSVRRDRPPGLPPAGHHRRAPQLWFWRIDGGAEGSFLHHHADNEQLGIIMRGALDFRIGEPDDRDAHGARTPATSTSRRRASGTATASSSATTRRRGAGSSTSSRRRARPRPMATRRDACSCAPTGGWPSTSAARSPTSCCSTRRPGGSSSTRRSPRRRRRSTACAPACASCSPRPASRPADDHRADRARHDADHQRADRGQDRSRRRRHHRRASATRC